MNTTLLISEIKRKKSFLCIGLDPDKSKMPPHLLKSEDPIFEFNKQLIDATHPYAVAYKPNIAFYESYGLEGWKSLHKTIEYLNEKHPEIFTIADAKRGDIGNTSTMYATAFFENLDFDAITVTPYMGKDSVEPFLAFENKTVILLALTSNSGSNDFQQLALNQKNEKVYENVIKTSLTWKNNKNLMYVVGATRADELKKIRALIPNHFLLVPGVGAQGGSLEEVCNYGINQDIGLLINSSRGIIYADTSRKFATIAQQEAKKLQQKMQPYLP